MRTVQYITLSVLLVVTVGVTFAAKEKKEIPDYVNICTRKAPNLEECFINSALALKPYLVQGVEEFNVPSLEPLLIEELVATENTAGLRITAHKVKAHGASNFFIKNLKINIDKHRYDMDIELPHLYIEAQYNVDGRILLLPIKGNGPMTGNFTKCTGRVLLLGELYKRDGEEHLRYTSLTMKIKISKGSIHLENLFGGEKVLANIVNQAINANFDTFAGEVLPSIESALGKVFLDLANNIVYPFTYDQLFPDV